MRGGAGLGYHQDDESLHSPGSPIVGFTFYNYVGRDCNADRDFVISENKAGSRVLCSVPTRNGDMIAMCGTKFQRKLWHSVPTVKGTPTDQ